MSVLAGLKVLDLSRGIAGPMTGMLLADHGAEVIRVEPPEGDPFSHLAGYRVWNRRKRQWALDLKSEEQREHFLAEVAATDILVESFAPGVTDRLGIDYETCRLRNPRLIYCSITGYGRGRMDSDRPGYDALVAARTGHQWEIRGFPGGSPLRLSGKLDPLSTVNVNAEYWVGPTRPGPLFSGVPWVSLGAFYIATVAINAAVRVRELTGTGQLVETSLLRGVLATTSFVWMSAKNADRSDFATWGVDPRAPKGFFKTSDGRWTHHFAPLPEFIVGAARADMQITERIPGPKTATFRIEPSLEEMLLIHHYMPSMTDAVKQFPAQEWVDAARKVGTPVQPVRSPEEALLDADLVKDGCVIEVLDPLVGSIRQVGRVIDWSGTREATPEMAANVDEPKMTQPPSQSVTRPASPLEGIRVLDIGMAVAAPYGAQILAQLGAQVTKITSPSDRFWLCTHTAMSCNRDRRAITIDLKTSGGQEVLGRLVRGTDVVLHNMRYDAASRLGVDYQAIRRLNPSIIYCHLLGHEQGPRQNDPGNDQTAGALTGTEWLDGGMDRGGHPLWSITSLGDVGAGFLAATAVVQALFHRDRTGEGQFVRTSILYAHLLNVSNNWMSADGQSLGPRQRPDAELFGWNALYRLYECADGWLCLAAVKAQHWFALCRSLGVEDLLDDARFRTPRDRKNHDSQLSEILSTVFAERTVGEWLTALRGSVPCEMSDPDYALRLFRDASNGDQDLIHRFAHPTMGAMAMCGLLFDMSETPGRLWGPPPLAGQHTSEILSELGYGSAEIEHLLAEGVVEQIQTSNN